jgi:hypothetical protein
MWGDSIGDSFGAGGLGLSASAKVAAVAARASASAPSAPSVTARAPAPVRASARVTVASAAPTARSRPSVRMGATSVSGRLPPEVIQRIVRQNFGRFRLCYENGLRNNPNLQGRVSVRFVIGRDGAVSNVGNGGSDLPDSGVVSCVVRLLRSELPAARRRHRHRRLPDHLLARRLSARLERPRSDGRPAAFADGAFVI